MRFILISNCLLCSIEIQAFLVYAKKAEVNAVSLDPSNTDDQMIPARQLKTAVGVDFSYDDQYVYWSEISADKISRQFLNGSGYETVISDGNFVHLPNLICIMHQTRKFCENKNKNATLS